MSFKRDLHTPLPPLIRGGIGFIRIFMKSIATINFKGGVGKTTASCWPARYVAEKMNKRVLIVDIDAQMSLTLALQLDEDKGTLNKNLNSCGISIRTTGKRC